MNNTAKVTWIRKGGEMDEHFIRVEWGSYDEMKSQFNRYIIKEADKRVRLEDGKLNVTALAKKLGLNRGTVRKLLRLAGL